MKRAGAGVASADRIGLLRDSDRGGALLVADDVGNVIWRVSSARS